MKPAPNRLILVIVAAMAAGTAVGYVGHLEAAGPAQAQELADLFQVISDIFLRSINLVIAPLVLSTLISGIAHMGNTSALGRLAVQAIAWFVCAGLVSLALGLVMVRFFDPGQGYSLVATGGPLVRTAAESPSLRNFIVELVPQSIFMALARNEVLQITVFSVLSGVALAGIGEQGLPLLRGVDALAQLMLKITGYVMLLAPLAVAASLAAIITVHGLDILQTYGKLVCEFYTSLALLIAVIVGAGAIVLGRRVFSLLRCVRVPVLIAFSTASSEAALPQMLVRLEAFGVPRRVASFILPLGYSFNLCGSMMYCAFASIFVAQVYGVNLSLSRQICMLLLIMVMSKGVAGVPRAALVVVAAVLPMFGLPRQGVMLLLGIDQILDMGRTGTNVLGNAVASAVVSEWNASRDQSPPNTSG